MRKGALIFCFLLAASVFAVAQNSVFELDPQQSRVTFTLPATMHTVHGTFAVKSGRVSFNAATGAAGGEIVVDATSGRTGNDGRDQKMHRDILESARFPQIVFTPQRVTGEVPAEGKSRVTIEGSMMLHGQPHAVSLTVPIEAHAGQVSGDAEFVVPYIQWGLKNPSNFLLRVSEKVTVEIHAVGRMSR